MAGPLLRLARAIAAMAFIDIATEAVKPATGSDLVNRLGKIKEWRNGRQKQVEAKLAVLPRMPVCQLFRHTFDKHTIKAHMDTDQRLYQLAALIWAGLTFVKDTRASCLLFDKDSRKPLRSRRERSDHTDAASPSRGDWRCPQCHMDALGTEWSNDWPMSDETGTGIYEECAWTLEGVKFISPLLEGKC